MFLSCLATDICVGLGSWVETETNKEENAEDVEIEDQLEVMRYVASMVQSKDKVSLEFISFFVNHRENKRWQQCQFVFSRAQETDVNLTLPTIMNALLRPEDIINIKKRVKQKRVGTSAFYKVKKRLCHDREGYFQPKKQGMNSWQDILVGE